MSKPKLRPNLGAQFFTTLQDSLLHCQDPAKAQKLNEAIDAGGWRNPEEIERKGEKEKGEDGNNLG